MTHVANADYTGFWTKFSYTNKKQMNLCGTETKECFTYQSKLLLWEHSKPTTQLRPNWPAGRVSILPPTQPSPGYKGPASKKKSTKLVARLLIIFLFLTEVALMKSHTILAANKSRVCSHNTKLCLCVCVVCVCRSSYNKIIRIAFHWEFKHSHE